MSKYKIALKIAEPIVSSKTYNLVIEGREPQIYEEVKNLVDNLCKKLDVKEYSIYEISEDVKLGKVVLLRKAMQSHAAKIHYDDVINEFGEAISGKLSLETIASTELQVETEKLRVESPCINASASKS